MVQTEVRDRLIKLINDCQYMEGYGIGLVEAQVDYLLKNNVIVPPCKVGDVVYCIEHKTIHECIVTLVKTLTYDNKTVFFVETECEIVSPFYSDGRKIKHGLSAVWKIEYGSWYRAFPTKEEAEKVLKEGNGRD